MTLTLYGVEIWSTVLLFARMGGMIMLLPGFGEPAVPGRIRLGFALAMAVQNLAAYAFTLVAARRLGPAEYSAVASLMGLLLVVVLLTVGAIWMRRLTRVEV